MSWAVGRDRNRRRHIGYGVPATCDHPGCGASIDRGLSYACGSGVVGQVDNCGLFFCGQHLAHFVEAGDGGEWVCERCANDEKAFDPTPDTVEWARHVLTDGSWAEWRESEPEWAAAMRAIAVEVTP